MRSSLAMAKLLSCILLTFPVSATAARARLSTVEKHLQVGATGTSGSGPICAITWTPKDGATPCTAEFEVKSCVTGCKLSIADHHHDKWYPVGFQDEEVTLGGRRKAKWCKCSNKAGRVLLKTPGKCGTPEQAAAKCWDHYKRKAVEDFESEFGADTMRVIPREDRYHGTSFSYDCDPERKCPEGEDCTQITLPSLWDSRTDSEKKMLANLVKKRALGGPGALTKQEKDLLNEFGQDDLREAGILAATEEDEAEVVNQIQAFTNQLNSNDTISDSPGDTPAPVGLFNDLAAKNDDGKFTVKELKDHYNELLEGTFISVNHLAAVAGLTDPDHVVAPEEYAKFIEPDCP